jgi:formate dehydrogenase subunit delta
MAVTTQVRMANEIAAQFRHLSHDAAVTAVAVHLRSFWDPRMRRQLLAAVDRNDAGIDELVAAAAPLLRSPG